MRRKTGKPAMLIVYLKIAYRNIVKNKALSVINVLGLALGMTAVILLALNIQYEYGVDQFHEKKVTLYKTYNKGTVNGKLQCWDACSPLLGPALKNDYPEVKRVARVFGTANTLSHGEKKLKAQGQFTDPAFLQMFSFPLRDGNSATVLKDIYSIVITEKLAHKIFGSDDPINKVIQADNKDNFRVSGVLKDLPDNTGFKFEFLMSWDYLAAKGIENASWSNQYATTFAELTSGTNIEALNNKVSELATSGSENKVKSKIFLYPFEKVHLYGRFVNGKPSGGDINNIKFFMILAFVILLIACINFMNLSTARSEKRAREVGVRKVLGAERRSLILQFIGESVLLSAAAAIVSIVLVQLLLPAFGSIGRVHLEIPVQSPLFWLSIITFVAFTGTLAGSYPAFYLSSFKPVKVLKGVLKNGNILLTPRKVLVVFQFTISIVFINFTIIFQNQISHTLKREVGFDKENLVIHPMTPDLLKNYEQVKHELLNSGTAVSVCKSSAPVTNVGSRVGGLKWQGMDAAAEINFDFIDTRQDFIKTNGLQLIAGRDINVNMFPGDTASCILNESAAKVMGFKNPVGQMIKDQPFNWAIVGVVKDFIVGSPSQLINPLLIKGDEGKGFISMRLSGTGSSYQHVKNAETILKKYNPGFLTEYQFADEQYAAKFRQTKRVGALVNVFAFIAIFISCMGLFGLVACMAESRTREIGVRKVLGASVTRITSLLTKDFVKLVAIAIVIASPVAWILLGSYLQQFSYRTQLDWWILLLSGGTALLIAFLTVSFLSVKAAMTNPAKSLSTE
jgi:putative ABC transport system permease protein